nr:linker for activation of T-cells family member 2 isoform X2 [Vicugna pacos]
MGAETELLWPGRALLLLLGLAAGLCARCSRPGAKRPEKIYEQRRLQENQQSFAVARTYTLVREAWPGTPVGTSSGVESARKDKLLRFSPSLEDPSSPRDPITMDYYSRGQLQKPLEDDDDTNSYENVLICKQNKTESDDEGSEDYQNSASIRQWRESRRVVEPVLREAPPSLAGSPDEDRSELHRLASTVARQDQSGPIPVF